MYARTWTPAGRQPEALVVIVHGQGEHGERYRHVAERMTNTGLAVACADLRGHGRSEGIRGHIAAIDEIIEDTAAIIAFARESFPDAPVILYGHSMGGNIALNAVLRRQLNVSALILSSPWLRLAFKPPAIKEWIGRGVAKLWPALRMSSGLKPDELFRPSELRLPAISEDPLNHTYITPKAYLEIQRAGEWALGNHGLLQLPVLLLHGDADRITSHAASQQLAQGMGSRCQWISVEGGLHELHNDQGGDRTIDLIIDWIQLQLSLNGD